MNEYTGNIGYLFSKLFFRTYKYHPQKKEDKEKGIKKENEKVIFKDLDKHSQILKNEVFLNRYIIPKSLGNCTFDLITSYPGLLVGSGYSHEVHGEEGLKLGFYFDHTTGLPLIPGSSVKGVLKSAFEKADGAYIEEIIEEIKTEERILLKNENKAAFEMLKVDTGIISDWSKTIFGDKDKAGEDIFFDACPVHSANEASKLLATDYITPHKDNPLKNPNPIQFLKVLPQVKFRFYFQLSDIAIKAVLKNELFRQILVDFGIGAKTNVGYGQFEKDGCLRMPTSKDHEDAQQKYFTGRLKEGVRVEAIVIKKEKTPNNHICLKLLIEGKGKEPIVFFRFPSGAEVEKRLSIKIVSLQKGKIQSVGEPKWH